jgi:hypothetical protein
VLNKKGGKMSNITCHTCNKEMPYRAFPNHRMAHKRRKEKCEWTGRSGSFIQDYSKEA